MKKRCFFFLLLVSYTTIFSQYLQFEDFPLEKMDGVYKEQGGVVARAVFELSCFVDQYIENFENNQIGGLESRLDFQEKTQSIFKKLNVYRRFIDELETEWAEKRETEGLKLFFKKMFSKIQSKKFLEKVTDQEFLHYLILLKVFLWDVANNAPHAQKQCLNSLQEKDVPSFKNFIEKNSAVCLVKIKS